MSQLLFDDITATVEIGFSTTAGANTVPFGGLLANITWTDVTAYVRGLSFQRGRSNELDQFQTGSASVVLSNADRRFDPLYASSPYAGALTPLRPIRIKLEHVDGSSITQTTPIFFGYIDGWPQTYETYGDATVTINASDMFKVLNNVTLPSLWADKIDSEDPLVWIRFNDGKSRRLKDIGFADAGTWTWSDASSVAISPVENTTVAGLIAGDSDQGGSFTEGIDLRTTLFGYPLQGFLDDASVEFWFQSTQADSESYGLVNFGINEYGIFGRMVSYLGYGVVQFCIGDNQSGGSTFDVWTSSVLVNDGRPHHVVATIGLTNSGLWVDGVKATKTESDVAAGASLINTTDGTVGGKSYYLLPDYACSKEFVGTIDELLIWDSPLTVAQITNHYEIGSGTFKNNERTDLRADRILDLIDWPSDGRQFGTGLSTMAPFVSGNKTALAALQEVEAAEQGMLLAGADGKVRFITRDEFNKATTAATFGDSTGELGYQDIVIEQSDADIANQVTVSRANGGTSTQIDATSQAAYWPRTLEVTDLQVDDDAFTEQLAKDLLRRYKTPQTRIRSLSGTVRGRSAADIQTMLDVEIGDRVTVKRRPQNVGSAISQDLQIQSINGEIGTDNMVLSFDLGPQPTQGFVLDSSTNGVLDTSRLAL
jgi:hypothetical protein